MLTATRRWRCGPVRNARPEKASSPPTWKKNRSNRSRRPSRCCRRCPRRRVCSHCRPPRSRTRPRAAWPRSSRPSSPTGSEKFVHIASEELYHRCQVVSAPALDPDERCERRKRRGSGSGTARQRRQRLRDRSSAMHRAPNGASLIEADLLSKPFTTFMTEFTIQPPQPAGQPPPLVGRAVVHDRKEPRNSGQCQRLFDLAADSFARPDRGLSDRREEHGQRGAHVLELRRRAL